MRLRLKAILLILLCFWMIPAYGFQGKLAPEQELRARALFSQLRCVVCQNQSIDSSDADVAKDLREIVREQINAGKSDVQIKDFLVARYGEFILLKPRFGWHTSILWAAPSILLIGVFWLFIRARKVKKSEGERTLSTKEEVDLAKILNRKN